MPTRASGPSRDTRCLTHLGLLSQGGHVYRRGLNLRAKTLNAKHAERNTQKRRATSRRVRGPRSRSRRRMWRRWRCRASAIERRALPEEASAGRKTRRFVRKHERFFFFSTPSLHEIVVCPSILKPTLVSVRSSAKGRAHTHQKLAAGGYVLGLVCGGPAACWTQPTLRRCRKCSRKSYTSALSWHCCSSPAPTSRNSWHVPYASWVHSKRLIPRPADDRAGCTLKYVQLFPRR